MYRGDNVSSVAALSIWLFITYLYASLSLIKLLGVDLVLS